jgi:signal transduction histidine kinase
VTFQSAFSIDLLFLGYLLAFGAAALVSFVGAYRARQISDTDTRRGLVALLAGSGGWAGTYLGVLLIPAPGLKVGFYVAGLIVGLAVVGAWLYFCSAFTGRTLHRNPSIRRAALTVFALVALSKVTNPLHELYFTIDPTAVPFPHLAVDHHAPYWLSVGLAYALATVGYFMLLELLVQVGSRGGSLGVLTGLTALPALFNAVGYVSPWLLDVAHEPIGVAVFAGGGLFLYRRRFRAVRFAGGHDDPAFVLGTDDRVLEYNRSAADLLPGEFGDRAAVGEPLGRVLPEVAEALGTGQPECRLDQSSRPRYYQVEESSIGGDEAHPDRFLLLNDVTKRKEREQALDEERSALRRMYCATADQESSFEEKIHRLIDLGREYLELPYGYLTRISEGTQRVEYAASTHPLLQPGEFYPLSESHCRETIETVGVLALQDTASDGASHPATERFGFGTYVGAPVIVEGELYGTFCFAGLDAREKCFTEREMAVLELMTRWVSYELEQRRAQEQLKQKNERLDRFAGFVSHDLRNPLNVAQGRLELAKREDDPTSHLEAADEALERINRIIQDVLALARGKQEVAPEDRESLSLAAVAETSWAHVETAGATLRVERDLGLRADEGRLCQLLENLFRNAVEHGGETVTVTVGALPDGFFVEDDGPGIPVEERGKVLEEGYSSNEAGTGFGLSIVRTVAEAHGWTLSVVDGRKGGARFEVHGVDTTEKVTKKKRVAA